MGLIVPAGDDLRFRQGVEVVLPSTQLTWRATLTNLLILKMLHYCLVGDGALMGQSRQAFG